MIISFYWFFYNEPYWEAIQELFEILKNLISFRTFWWMFEGYINDWLIFGANHVG
jgi:hypothetical protein